MSQMVKVEGEVVYSSHKSQMVEFYSEEIDLPDSVTSKAQARSMLKAGLLADVLRKKVNGFKRVRTIEVTGMTQGEGKATDEEYKKLLMEANQLACVPEGLERYKEGAARENALKKAIDKAKERLKKAAAKKAKEDGKLEDGFVD